MTNVTCCSRLGTRNGLHTRAPQNGGPVASTFNDLVHLHRKRFDVSVVSSVLTFEVGALIFFGIDNTWKGQGNQLTSPKKNSLRRSTFSKKQNSWPFISGYICPGHPSCDLQTPHFAGSSNMNSVPGFRARNGELKVSCVSGTEGDNSPFRGCYTRTNFTFELPVKVVLDQNLGSRGICF